MKRAIVMTLGMSLAGALCAAIAAALMFTTVLMRGPWWRFGAWPLLISFVGAVAAIAGAMLAPLAGWLILRRLRLVF